MPFKSSEIRWFSEEKELLWQFYEDLFPKGIGDQEQKRTDYYLHTGLVNTGVKIREGQHEIKVKSAKDEQTKYGLIENWIKWSMPAEENILNTVSPALLHDWIAIDKQRWSKKFEIKEAKKLRPIQSQFVDEGCGIEFTRIDIPSLKKTLYTLGFEGFSTSNNCSANLIAALEFLEVDTSRFNSLLAISYPGLLSQLEEQKE